MRYDTSEYAAAAVEYGVMVALISAVLVPIVAVLGKQLAAAFQTVSDALPPLPVPASTTPAF